LFADRRRAYTSDEDLHKFLVSLKGTTGLAMVKSNLDAFAARSLSARRAGRSLDLMYHVWHSELTGRLLAAATLATAISTPRRPPTLAMSFPHRPPTVMRKVDGWEMLAEPLSASAIDLAA
jgi:kynureninase